MRHLILSACRIWIASAVCLAGPAVAAPPQPVAVKSDLVTDRSGASDAVGPTAVKWGFMCSIAARRGDCLFAIDFTRTPDAPWNTRLPNEAPVALWRRLPDGGWTSTLLDSPARTYQTPSLLLSPNGRANVFTLPAGGGAITWFRAQDDSNTSFKATTIPMEWGAYMSGGIDPRGRALMVYWAGYHPDPKLQGFAAMDDGYSRSTLGYTLIDTRSGKHVNGLIDTPGAPFCYSQVAYARNGAHVLTVRSVVSPFLICGSRNHYTELRYYYSPDPRSKAPWKRITLCRNDDALFQPLGLEVDRAGRAHLLYFRMDENADGKGAPIRLFYAVSVRPASAGAEPQFVQHEIRSDGWDGRLFQTRSGRLFVVAYQVGAAAQIAEVLDGRAGTLSPWRSIAMPLPQCRLFPIGLRGGSTLTDEIEGVFVGVPGTPNENSLYHFRLPIHGVRRRSTP